MNFETLFKEIKVSAISNYKTLRENSPSHDPLLISERGQQTAFLCSGLHGRSIIIPEDKSDFFYVQKGGGLTYFGGNFINICELDYGHIWGGLGTSEALREFDIGSKFVKQGGTGPEYNAVYEFDAPSDICRGFDSFPLAVLEMRVRCPIRVSDFGLFNKSILKK